MTIIPLLSHYYPTIYPHHYLHPYLHPYLTLTPGLSFLQNFNSLTLEILALLPFGVGDGVPGRMVRGCTRGMDLDAIFGYIYCIILILYIYMCIILYYIILIFILYYIYTILYYIILYFTIIILYYIILYYIILHYITLYYIILYYGILYCIHSAPQDFMLHHPKRHGSITVVPGEEFDSLHPLGHFGGDWCLHRLGPSHCDGKSGVHCQVGRW